MQHKILGGPRRMSEFSCGGLAKKQLASAARVLLFLTLSSVRIHFQQSERHFDSRKVVGKPLLLSQQDHFPMSEMSLKATFRFQTTLWQQCKQWLFCKKLLSWWTQKSLSSNSCPGPLGDPSTPSGAVGDSSFVDCFLQQLPHEHGKNSHSHNKLSDTCRPAQCGASLHQQQVPSGLKLDPKGTK